MARQITKATKLGALIHATGLYAYQVAGQVGINYNQLIRYVNLQAPIANHHLLALCDYFQAEPEELVGLVEH